MENISKVIIATLIIANLFACSSENNISKHLEGKVKREVVSLAPKVPGRVLKILVEEGANVKKGDTLAIIDIPEVEAKLEQAEGAVLSAQSQYEMALNGATDDQLKQVVSMCEAAEEQYKFAEKSYNRIKNMYEDSLVSAQKYDEVSAKYRAAKAQLNAANAKKAEVMSGVRNEKIHMAEGQLKRAKGALKEANIAYNERFIIAPKLMSIESITLHEGELALPGYNLFTGYDLNKVYFRFTIRESEINKFKKGAEYKVLLPYDKKEIDTKLSAVKQLAAYANRTSSYPNYQLGEAVYELKLTPKNISEVTELYNNYTGIIEKY